jgi:hypothetical protein
MPPRVARPAKVAFGPIVGFIFEYMKRCPMVQFTFRLFANLTRNLYLFSFHKFLRSGFNYFDKR